MGPVRRTGRRQRPVADALNVLEDELTVYTSDVAVDEQSHADFINAFLVAHGKAPPPHA